MESHMPLKTWLVGSTQNPEMSGYNQEEEEAAGQWAEEAGLG